MVNLAMRTARAYPQRPRTLGPRGGADGPGARSGGRWQRAHERAGRRPRPPHLARRADGRQHPVADFLFTYYSQRPAQLRRWHPGSGVALAGGDDRRRLALLPARRRPAPSLDVAELAGRPRGLGALHPRPAGARPRRGPPSSAASGCTSGRWSTGRTPRRSGTRTGRCASAPRAPTRSSSRTGSAARTSTRSASSPPPARPRNTLQPDARRPADARAAGLPARRDGPLQARLPAQPRWCRAGWRRTASSWPATSASSTCARRRTTCATSATSRCGSRPPRARRSTSPRSAPSPGARRRCAPGWWRRATCCWAQVAPLSPAQARA